MLVKFKLGILCVLQWRRSLAETFGSRKKVLRQVAGPKIRGQQTCNNERAKFAIYRSARKPGPESAPKSAFWVILGAPSQVPKTTQQALFGALSGPGFWAHRNAKWFGPFKWVVAKLQTDKTASFCEKMRGYEATRWQISIAIFHGTLWPMGSGPHAPFLTD